MGLQVLAHQFLTDNLLTDLMVLAHLLHQNPNYGFEEEDDDEENERSDKEVFLINKM